MLESKGAILCVVGARPNFMKIAPLMAAFPMAPTPISAKLIHTGQHYDEGMKGTFFEQLGIPEPDIDLGVGSGTHAVQTAEVMRRFEPVVDAHEPAAVLVVGDVNSTVACALVAAKKGVPVIHVEAGLRSFDRSMPEEINRVLTDQLSDLLFTTEESARENLVREGISEEKIFFVGNIMMDTLHRNLPRAVPPAQTLAGLPGAHWFESERERYGVVTLHRPSNVDDRATLKRLLETLREISDHLPLVFPIHPRTAERIRAAGLEGLLDSDRIARLTPQGYLQMLGLVAHAQLVLTDSGGLQEETTALGVPCITLRENTERPVTVARGTNTVVGSDATLIMEAVAEVLATGGKRGRVPELWEGGTALRIKAVIQNWLEHGTSVQAVAG